MGKGREEVAHAALARRARARRNGGARMVQLYARTRGHARARGPNGSVLPPATPNHASAEDALRSSANSRNTQTLIPKQALNASAIRAPAAARDPSARFGIRVALSTLCAVSTSRNEGIYSFKMGFRFGSFGLRSVPPLEPLLNCGARARARAERNPLD